MNEDQKRMFLAIALSAGVLFLWQAFFAPAQQIKTVENVKRENVIDNSKTAKIPTTNTVKKEDVFKVTEASEEPKSFTVRGDENEVVFNNNLSVSTVKTGEAKYDFRKIVGPKAQPFIILFKKNGSYRPLFLELTNNGDSIEGSNSTHGISFSGKISEDGKFNYSLNSREPLEFRIIFDSTKEELNSTQIRDFTFLTGTDVERFTVGDEDDFDGSIKWAGIDYSYHLFAFVLDEKKKVRLKSANEKMIIDFTDPVTSINAYIIFTKKNYDNLTKLGDNLKLSVDFGIFGILAVPILRGIQFIYKYIANYGIAIVLITILLRIITFPLYYKSIVSMKKMQKVQPELTKLKEKFKDDPQRMQKETMQLFKKAGANPLGGCFPMLLQMPIFFAFYQVLYNAVELVDAPFFGWMQDLSSKDPFYILPVLMAVAMFAQQKLTPTATADPTQQKVMMAMPLIFGFIMKDLPSGLVLYIFVSTLFGIGQQLIVYKTLD